MADKMVGAKNILVTGATGFVGACLTRRLMRTKNNIHVIIRRQSNLWRIDSILNKLRVHYADLNDAEQIERVVKKIKPNIVYHLAAYGAYPFQKEAEPILRTNIFGTLNLLNACSRIGVEMFVNTGSSSEYGTKLKPMRESDIVEPNSFYAVAKTGQTLLCQHLAREQGLPVVTLRLFSVYGPYEEPTRLVPVLVNRCLKNGNLDLASPETARDFVFVGDVVEAYVKASRRPNLAGQIFNIGTGRQSTLRDIVSVVVRLTNADVEQKWGVLGGRSFDTNVWVADASKAKELLKWQPKHDLESGLRKTIGWFKKNKHLYG